MPHPILVGVMVAALCAVALLVASRLAAARVVMGWRPASADRAQVALDAGAAVADPDVDRFGDLCRDRAGFVEQARRHEVRPGITGWAQLKYQYGSTEQDAIEKLQYDLYYVKNHSLLLDLVIMLQTAEVILWGKGAR